MQLRRATNRSTAPRCRGRMTGVLVEPPPGGWSPLGGNLPGFGRVPPRPITGCFVRPHQDSDLGDQLFVLLGAGARLCPLITGPKKHEATVLRPAAVAGAPASSGGCGYFRSARVPWFPPP